jgi:hypothetical protein
MESASKDQLGERLMAFVSEWNERAHPLRWTERSLAKVLTKSEAVAGQVMAA